MKAEITLNIKKCKFNTTKVNYLEMVFLLEGLEIPKEKLDSILEWLILTDLKQV